MDFKRFFQMLGGFDEVAEKLCVGKQSVYVWSHKKRMPKRSAELLRAHYPQQVTDEVFKKLIGE